MIELCIKVSNSEHSYTHKILSSEDVFLSQEDSRLSAWVKEAVDKFKDLSPDEAVDNVVLKAKMDW